MDTSSLGPKTAKKIAPSLNKQLKEMAARKGWNHPIAVTSDNGVIGVSYNETDTNSIFDNEYGSTEVSANAVLRPWMIDAEFQIKNAMVNETVEYLFQEGILP
jgi:hypothetical protein